MRITPKGASNQRPVNSLAEVPSLHCKIDLKNEVRYALVAEPARQDSEQYIHCCVEGEVITRTAFPMVLLFQETYPYPVP